MPPKDIQLLQHIVRYCQQIYTVREKFHLTQTMLEENFLL